jgi:amidohydrolase
MPQQWLQELDQALDDQFARIVEVRRWLHAHPEPSGHEFHTSRYLAQLLAHDGFSLRQGPQGRGLICEGGGGQQLTPLALRADIDGLRIHDSKQVSYCSQNPGVMHACGHDAHAAIVYGTMSALRALEARHCLPWPIRYRVIFQPAEETCEGAQQMIASGALQDVSAILALHVDPTLRVGQIGLRRGVLTANCDEMWITIRGRGGHAARPHEASDPIAAAAQLINALYLHIPRVTDSQEAVVVTIGQMQGGDNANVIPEEAQLRGTIRTLDRTVRGTTIDHVRRLAYGVGETTLTKIQVDFRLGSHSVCNDSRMIDVLHWSGVSALGTGAIHEISRPSMGSEDFAYYLEQVPGALMRLGSASADRGTAALHTPYFDVDEAALRVGARVLARAVVRWFDPEFQQTANAPAGSVVPGSTGGSTT